MRKHRLLITGGAGFIGVNAARRFLEDGWKVSLWDNLSRPGSRNNLDWVRQFGPVEFFRVDLRHERAVNEHLQKEQYDMVLHCAGQVAVTHSVTDPRHDLENNILATFNLLEALRMFRRDAFVIFASTNKVYGAMENVRVVERDGSYLWPDFPEGIAESQPLDFHSPYGCSKGAADQYVRDYARTYGLATTCFRQSCIYGYRQFGLEDQGWVAWFLIAHALNKPITIFGDGKQSRDLLFIDDLVAAYRLAWEAQEKVAGQVYNIGGGPRNLFSLRQLISWLEVEGARPVELSFAPPREGDQKLFVADIRKALEDFGWRPSCAVADGIRKLNRWVNANLESIKEVVTLSALQKGGRTALSTPASALWTPADASALAASAQVSP